MGYSLANLVCTLGLNKKIQIIVCFVVGSYFNLLFQVQPYQNFADGVIREI